MIYDQSNLINILNVNFSYSRKIILKDISLNILRNKITAIIGPSGIGKTTLLRLICGQILPDSGEIFFDGESVPKMSRSRLYKVRKRMSMLFQSGALFTDMNVFDNVAYPLREHTNLPESIIRSMVMMKLETVGLRSTVKLMPLELSSGMIRRVAMARSIALEPDMIMFDEPFIGQDPITVGILVKLICEINKILGITCIIVSHDIPELLSIADYIYILAHGKVIAHGNVATLRSSKDPLIYQFLNGVKCNSSILYHFNENYQNYRNDLLGIEN